VKVIDLQQVAIGDDKNTDDNKRTIMENEYAPKSWESTQQMVQMVIIINENARDEHLQFCRMDPASPEPLLPSFALIDGDRLDCRVTSP
jgi:hypothetical protein